jgi:acyl carrier protein
VTRDDLIDLIASTITEFSSSEVDPASMTTETRLFGEAGLLDSIGLVSAVIELEQRLRERFDRSFTLADERAMSQARSPFRTVGSLADYILQLAHG